jgi:hypothetical protein
LMIAGSRLRARYGSIPCKTFSYRTAVPSAAQRRKSFYFWKIYKSFLFFLAKDTYNTFVSYKCVNGSQFDTNNDKKGDAVSISSRCLWNKTWSPYPVLPPCYITHCVNPFPIPNDTFLQVSVQQKRS